MLTPEKIAELKQKNPGVELHKLTVGDEVFVLRPPTRAEWQRFEQQRDDERLKPVSRDNLVMPCVVHPDLAALTAILDRKPATIIPLANKVVEIAGIEEKVHSEKL